MIEILLGNKTAAKIMIQLYHYEELYPRRIAADCNVPVSAVQRQFEKFENAGLLVSKLVGKTRIYSFNKKSAYCKAFLELIKIEYDSIPFTEKENIFVTRARPRRKGKPVIKGKK